MKFSKIAISIFLAAAMSSSAVASAPTVDQISRCNMTVPAPLSWMVAYIPCWAYARAS